MMTMMTTMDKKRQELRFVSMGMFALIALQIANILQIYLDLDAVDTTGLDAAALTALPMIGGLMIGLSVIGVIVLAILGVKGVREADTPSTSRYHIVLAFIASAFFSFGLISEFVELFRSTAAVTDFKSLLIPSLFVIDTLHYAVTARTLRLKK